VRVQFVDFADRADAQAVLACARAVTSPVCHRRRCASRLQKAVCPCWSPRPALCRPAKMLRVRTARTDRLSDECSRTLRQMTKPLPAAFLAALKARLASEHRRPRGTRAPRRDESSFPNMPRTRSCSRSRPRTWSRWSRCARTIACRSLPSATARRWRARAGGRGRR